MTNMTSERSQQMTSMAAVGSPYAWPSLMAKCFKAIGRTPPPPPRTTTECSALRTWLQSAPFLDDSAEGPEGVRFILVSQGQTSGALSCNWLSANPLLCSCHFTVPCSPQEFEGMLHAPRKPGCSGQSPVQDDSAPATVVSDFRMIATLSAEISKIILFHMMTISISWLPTSVWTTPIEDSK